MYSPIIGSDENDSGHEALITPRSTMNRTIKLQEIYVELRTELLEEVDLIETRIIKPATDAKGWIQPLKKVIKKRGDRKVRSSVRLNPDMGTKGCSWILKSTKRGLIMRERSITGLSVTTPL